MYTIHSSRGGREKEEERKRERERGRERDHKEVAREKLAN